MWAHSSEIDAFTLIAPFPAALIASPVLIASMALDWRVSHSTNPSVPRRTSIASYLLLTAVIAVMIAALGVLPKSAKGWWAEKPVTAGLIFLTPVLAAGMLLVAGVRVFLGLRSLRKPIPIAVLMGWYTLALVIAPISPYLVTIFDQAASESVPMVFFGLAWATLFFVGCTTFGLVIRSRGYRLGRASDRLPSAASDVVASQT